MKITGTLINYYFHCKRQCYLLGNRLNLEDNSEDVKIGKALHEDKFENKENTEIAIENIKVDKLTNEYLTEVKKSDSSLDSCKWQLIFYLKVLKDKGIDRKGKLEFIEKKKGDKKIYYYELDEYTEKELEQHLKNIEKLIEDDKIPDVINKPRCKKCAYYEYCYI